MITFEQALSLAGLIPREVIADGRWRRCKTTDKPRKMNGAYKLAIGGGRGWFRNWATDDSVQVWDDEREHEVRPVDMERMRRVREAERARRIASMRAAREFWCDAGPMRTLHPYLADKRLTAQGCAGLRVSAGLLVIPVLHGQWLISVQTIAPAGEKRFWPGAPVKGGAFVLERSGAAITCVCEGLATGLAIYQSMRHARVIVAFDAGNLLPVVQRIKPVGSVILCADNDHETAKRTGVNTGLEKARNAAELLGCGVAHPDGIAGTDWADALIEWGSARRVEREIQRSLSYVGAG